MKAQYAGDHEFIGNYKAEDIFTEDERMLNYMESFHEYPIQYRGRRDYSMLNKLNQMRREMTPDEFWSIRFKFDETYNIVMA